MAQEMQNGMDKKTIKALDQDSKLDVMIDYICAIDERTRNIEQNRQEDVDNRKKHCKDQQEVCNDRFLKIERLHYGIIGVLLLANVVLPPIIMSLWS